MKTAADFEQLYPEIPWREPVKLTVGSFNGWACRVCIAALGLRGIDVLRGTAIGGIAFYELTDALRHIAEEHPGDS